MGGEGVSPADRDRVAPRGREWEVIQGEASVSGKRGVVIRGRVAPREGETFDGEEGVSREGGG